MLDTITSWSDDVPNLDAGRYDRLVWLGHPSGAFSIASAWDLIRFKGQIVPWHSFIWDRCIAPRHGFLLWLISLNRLPTQVVLLNYRRITKGVCAFCRCRPDSIDHLFFGCKFIGTLALFWATKCNLAWRNDTWHGNLR